MVKNVYADSLIRSSHPVGGVKGARMALYWPEARFALDLMGEGEGRPGKRYPPDVLVISVREEQVADPEFLEEMRELVVRRTERFGDKGEKACDKRARTEGGIPTISDIFEGLVADGDDGCPADEDDLEDFSVDDLGLSDMDLDDPE